MRVAVMRLIATLALAAGACSSPNLSESFPPPVVPADNPTTAAAVELGRHLFYDTRLSFNESISCSSCHKQRFAFADETPVSLGATGEPGPLNAPTLTNAAYASPLTWSLGRVETIEEQLLGPMFGEAPIEMGISGNEAAIADRLRADPIYVELFSAAFDAGSLTGQSVLDDVRFSLASFARSLVSENSAFDQFLRGDSAAISVSARRGSELFYSQRLGCGGCHAGFALTEASRSQASSGVMTSPFHNIGLYNVDGEGSYPESAPGLIGASGIARDAGRFRVPTLRNVAVSAPYMHDGSVATLEEVIEIYEGGGRNVEGGEDAGDGRLSPLRSDKLADFELTPTERADLLEFLRSLTDDEFLSDVRHANPW